MNNIQQRNNITFAASIFMSIGLLLFSAVSAHVMINTSFSMTSILTLINPLTRSLPDTFLQQLNLLAHALLAVGFGVQVWNVFSEKMIAIICIFIALLNVIMMFV